MAAIATEERDGRESTYNFCDFFCVEYKKKNKWFKQELKMISKPYAALYI